jgi:ribosomal protein S17
MKGKIITVFVVVIVFSGIFYFIDKMRTEELNIINEDFNLTKGVVVDKSVYKGRNIQVKYFVDGKEYIASDGISEDDNVQVGDTVSIKYSLQSPELMITQFNDKF